MKSCQHLNNILAERYDIDLLVEPISRQHIVSVYEHYRDQRSMMRLHEGVNNFTPQYTKAYLISEAAMMILREIAPKRRKRQKGAKQ